MLRNAPIGANITFPKAERVKIDAGEQGKSWYSNLLIFILWTLPILLVPVGFIMLMEGFRWVHSGHSTRQGGIALILGGLLMFSSLLLFYGDNTLWLIIHAGNMKTQFATFAVSDSEFVNLVLRNFTCLCGLSVLVVSAYFLRHRRRKGR